ncbi:ribose-5-phosphate isomerase RpiA [Sphingosinicella sp. BN140058]|uniref:ribose-5-phosphate isomerase RpiA n=1 Tax=Sphingosinicella sp. BN140058 TaxID=1892855 RepID=UPI001010DD21|nr:ribose-5-phosphate isomerase RpiA [Sphingosinicella sp. BN140058]QAY76287.1 ribose-5-phosphate isomerase RpiA [Sphingosinicella sp. BN140058]
MIDTDAQKRAAADAAVAEIRAGMLVGLGTGSTAAFAIAALARRVEAGLDVRTVATSHATAAAAEAAGLAVLDMADVARVDLAIDGVDEIDAAFRAIKGGGGALLREKIVAAAADRMIAIADAGKKVDRLGRHPLPLEVLPFARSAVAEAVAALGAIPVLRVRGGAPILTDQNNVLIDCHFPTLGDPEELARALAEVPGILGHGLFLSEIDALYLAGPEGVRLYERSGSQPRRLR